MKKEIMQKKDARGSGEKGFVRGLIFAAMFIFLLNLVSANSYVVQLSFSLPDSIYYINESLAIRGSLIQSNYTDNGTLVSSLSVVQSANINITIENSSRAYLANYTLTTDSLGKFYSNSSYRTTALTIKAPQNIGDYFLITSYTDPNNTRWVSELAISVVNQTIDVIRVNPKKAIYNPSETVQVVIEAIRQLGDKILSISNVSVNGSLRNSSQGIISNLNCTTATNGKCTTTVSAPATYGSYILEIENFKSFSSFLVVPFSFNLYMKDDLGKSVKNVFALGEQARVEVGIVNASDSDSYSFSGYIIDSSGNVVKTITSTTLNSNNSFTNSFLFTVDALTFGYKPYRATITVSKAGDGSITASTSFEVKDWVFNVNKKTSSSGFEYEYSVFPNKTMNFEAYPTLRGNGTIIANLNITFFNVTLQDNLGNIVSNGTVLWNATCGKEGCYELSVNSTLNTGQHVFYVSLTHGGVMQTKSQTINVIDAVLTAQSTDATGATKELFGTNEFIYLSLNSYNTTSLQFNLSNAELFSLRYMNGTELSYTQVTNFSMVNATNNISEWAWNQSEQKLKLDVPKTGGMYTAFVFGNNKSAGAIARFIVNPYDSCIVPKDTPGTVGSGNYYVWQFKTTDTIYFEIKLLQANNPTGKATALNMSNNNTEGGRGSACVVDTNTRQVVNNATISIKEVRNTQTGAIQNINTTESVCQSSDSSGGYSCTLKPLNKWQGGVSSVEFQIAGQDGTIGITTGKFESRAFYLYGYSNNWQNGPNNNLTFTLQMYEAGGNWWGSSGGLSGTVTLKKVEYMGSYGEWLWPPVDSGYNVSNVSATTITSGSGTMNIPASAASGGAWKTGNYRTVLQATTSTGDSDYGYAWFAVKLWDVYGQPVECSTTGCNYKSYFNSKENITLFIKISQAGDYSYNAVGGQSLGGGNVSVSVKKIQDCRTWPCKELNASDYTSTAVSVNESSPWYWNANISRYGNYLLYINSTKSRWNTGWYSVILDINGSDTGYAWFNSIAFYVETQPVDRNGTTYKYSIRGDQPMYFNLTTTKSYKYSYGYGSSSIRYNSSDYVNITVDSIVLRVWEQSTQQVKEFKYPSEINATSNASSADRSINVTGNGLINVTYLNGSWPSGYYWGEIVMKNTDNETSSGWLWFSVRPFRVQLSSSQYSIDSDQCINATINIYDPDWYSSTLYYGNYSVTKVYENVWTYSGSSFITYSNFTNSSFNATGNIRFCPNNGSWGSGSWGGYHYLNVVAKDNVQNNSEVGWLSFRTIPFQINWGSIQGGSNKATNANFTVQVNLSRSTGGAASGNLTNIYQWRYDSSTQYRGTKESYVFNVGNCWSNVSGQCNITGVQNITIYPPTGGWKIGYNYLQAGWTKVDDATSKVEDWQGIYLEGRESYNGYFSNIDSNGNWKYYFNTTENITIKLYARDSNYNSVAVNVTNVQYAYSQQNCYSDWCRSFSSATWGIAGGGVQTSSSGSVITIAPPSGGWTKGDYSIKTSVSGSAGTATITGGSVRIKDFINPNITMLAPTNNNTYTTSNLTWRITTAKNAQCSINIYNYNNLHNYFCGGWNVTTNNGSFTPQVLGACNTTLYPNYNGTTYYYEYISDSYKSSYNGTISTWSSGSTGMTTGSTSHSYTLNTTLWPNNQYYGIYTYCYDADYNAATSLAAFKVQR